MSDHQAPRALSNDEKLAAEAAFAGRPFNAKWSARARMVYDGIVKLLPAPPIQEDSSANRLTESVPSVQEVPSAQQPVPTQIPFKQAIETGALIDVTATAKQLGLSFPVTVTKPLWEVGIAPSNTLTQEEQSAR